MPERRSTARRRTVALQAAALSCALWLGIGWLRHRWPTWPPGSGPDGDWRGGLRLLLALSLGWPALLGIGAASLLAHCAGWGPALGAQAALLRAALSALSPLAALRTAGPLLHIRDDLRGLRGWQLLVLAVLSTLYWELPDAALLVHAGVEHADPTSLLRRVGVDLAATLGLIYAAGYAWHVYARRIAHDAA